MDLKETNILGDAIGEHWYYKSKADAMSQVIANLDINTVLDVGAGSGFFSKHLLKQSSATKAVCVDTSYEADIDEFIDEKPIFFRRSIDQTEADLVLFMDVLEHVDDDIGLLESYNKKVKKGAYILITVPAFNSLWSNHDIFLEHRRRYRLKEIESVARLSGLEVVHGSYFFGFIFPIALTLRKLEKFKNRKQNEIKSQLKLHYHFVNSILTTICRAELFLQKYNRIAGLSAFVLAKKLY